jgi:hypothetical protein
MSEFEDGLWRRLVEDHDADAVSLTSKRRTARRTVVGGGATATAAVTAAAVIALSAGGAAPAYAMTQNADGSYTFTINDLATAAPELNAKFKQLGIDETVVPVEASCTNVNEFLFADPNAKMTDSFTFKPGNKWLEPGFTGVVAAEQLSNGEVAISMGAIPPPVPSCYSAQAFTMQQTGDANGVPTVTSVPLTPTTTTSGG